MNSIFIQPPWSPKPLRCVMNAQMSYILGAHPLPPRCRLSWAKRDRCYMERHPKGQEAQRKAEGKRLTPGQLRKSALAAEGTEKTVLLFQKDPDPLAPTPPPAESLQLRTHSPGQRTSINPGRDVPAPRQPQFPHLQNGGGDNKTWAEALRL